MEKKYLYYILILIAYLAVVIQGFTQSINEGLARVMACSVAFYIFYEIRKGMNNGISRNRRKVRV